MNRTTSITLTALLVVAMVAVPIAAASVVSSGAVQDDPEPDDGAESIEPGEQLSAAVGVQNAELEGDVSERAFGIRIATAESNETKATVVAEQFAESERRLGTLEARLAELNESRTAGELSEGRYRAEVAKTVAEMRTIERQAALAERTAVELPDGAFADRGVDRESIRTLRERAGELGGPETAAVARSIAGDDVGRSVGADRPPVGADRTPDGAPDTGSRPDDAGRPENASSSGPPRNGP
ncbi:hypothetical protein [Natrinema ejinorense]|uniref:Uncharacterized protein n=1 Tax=Natrinema ejinorense TaxID=373386 RepID=A0A2A5QZL7_9EURY|nr:hypothetical protein [Natrinema ejinorense]PCR92209.1 hypothetical protein CP557_17745 [Natrinema ejinorense]